jgi:hypothetical protein
LPDFCVGQDSGHGGLMGKLAGYCKDW